jgi:hypothetical protein
MIFKKDNFIFGIILGFVAPILGVFIFKYSKFKTFTYKEVFQFMYVEPGHGTLSVALSLSLLLNALLFTLYINTNKDKTAKGIFGTTVIYGIFVLLLKTFG